MMSFLSANYHLYVTHITHYNIQQQYYNTHIMNRTL